MIALPFVHVFKDRHGKVRRYFRRPGFKGAKLPGEPGSDAFMLAYQAALAGEKAPKAEIGATRTKQGTVAALTVAYFNDAQFKGLAKSTQDTYRGIIERFRAEHGSQPVAMLGPEHIKAMLGKKTDTPAAANNWLRLVRMLMQFAVSIEMRRDDPTVGIKNVRRRDSDGFAIWPEELIDQFREHHKLGSRARLAFELLLNTIQRRSDIVRMGRQHIREGVLSIKQQKTGMQVDIPVLPDLQQALEATPVENLTYLTTDFGKPFTAAGYGNWFHQMCIDAKIPAGYASHGLRKAGATRLAEHGCTDHEIMAWGGWTTIKEVQRYTKRANRKRLALSGAEKLKSGTPIGKPSEKVCQIDPQAVDKKG